MSKKVKDETSIQIATMPTMQDRFFGIIEKMALITEADVAKFERIMSMQVEMRDYQAKQAYLTALTAVQADMPKLIKDKVNPQTRSKYVSLDSILEHCVPKCREYGIIVQFKELPCDKEGHVIAATVLSHTSAAGTHTEVFPYMCPLDTIGTSGNRNKTDVHGKASAISYAIRYSFSMAMCIIKGDDDDGNRAGTPPVAPVLMVGPQELVTLGELMSKAGVEPEKIYARYGVKELKNLTMDDFKKACIALNATIEKLNIKIEEVKENV